MSTPTVSADAVLVSTTEDRAFIRVVGRGSFRMGPALKQFGQSMLARGIRRFQVDLGACTSMDSTFMGLLAGLALQVRRLGDGGVSLVQVRPDPLRSLLTLGLDAHLEIHATGPGCEGPSSGRGTEPEAALDHEAAARDRRVAAETALQAHEDLVAAHDANLAKFQDVLAYLREDLARMHPTAAGRTGPAAPP